MSCQKKTLIFDWTVLEDQEELEAVLWTRFRVVSPGSEIVWKLSENVSCSRTRERAEKPWFQKRGPLIFFSTACGKFFFEQYKNRLDIQLGVSLKYVQNAKYVRRSLIEKSKIRHPHFWLYDHQLPAGSNLLAVRPPTPSGF